MSTDATDTIFEEYERLLPEYILSRYPSSEIQLIVP